VKFTWKYQEVCSSNLTETCSRSMDFAFVEKPGWRAGVSVGFAET